MSNIRVAKSTQILANEISYASTYARVLQGYYIMIQNPGPLDCIPLVDDYS